MVVANAVEADTAITTAGLTVGDWLAAGAILVTGIVVGRTVQGLLVRVVHRGDADQGAAVALGRFVGFVFAAAGLVYGLSVLGLRLGPLVGALGIGGIAVAFAGQTILANFLGSIILQLRRPFHRGDQIATNDCEGTVVDVNFRTVVLRSFDGERLLIPCSQVLANPITNYTALGQRRTTFSVSVGYDADLESARGVLLDAVASVEGARQPQPRGLGRGVCRLGRPGGHPLLACTRHRNAVAGTKRGGCWGQACPRAQGIEIPFPQRVLHFTDDSTFGQRPSDACQEHRAGGSHPPDGSGRPSAG